MAFDLNSLSPFLGFWSGEGEISPNPWTKSGPAWGRWSFRMDDAGKNLIHDYEQSNHEGMGFDGHGVFCTDPDSEDLLWFWFDDRGFPPLTPSRGGWQKNMLILSRSTPRGLGRSTFRIADGELHYLIEAQPTGQPDFSDVMRGRYRRN